MRWHDRRGCYTSGCYLRFPIPLSLHGNVALPDPVTFTPAVRNNGSDGGSIVYISVQAQQFMKDYVIHMVLEHNIYHTKKSI